MGPQKAIAEEIIRGRADYVLALKGNQESMHRAVIEHIDERLEGDLEGAEELTTTDRGHGRREERTYLQLPAPAPRPAAEPDQEAPRLRLVRRVPDGSDCWMNMLVSVRPWWGPTRG